MASVNGLTSPESSVSSLLASSGRLRSSLHPERVHTILYKDKQYVSATDALDAYIRDYQRSLRDRETSTGKLELPKQLPRNRDVLKTSLTDGELKFLNLPVRQRDSDGLSVTTDDLLVLPNDGSLPVTHTSALLSRSGSFPLGLSFSSSSRSHTRTGAPKRSTRRPVPAQSRKSLPVDDLLMADLSLHRQAPPPNLSSANQTLPPDTPRSSYLPRWMTSQKSEMDFSGMTSVPDLKYPAWLRQCEDGPLPPGVPSWVGELEESGGGQPHVKGHPGEADRSRSVSDPRLLSSQKIQTAKRVQIHEGQLFRDDRIDSLILRAEQMLTTPSFSLCDVKEHNRSRDTEDALDADRSWDNPPVTFKSPVPVGGAEEPEELQRSKSAASCSSGYSSRKHPGPVEALKHMLFRLQAVEHKISQSQTSSEDEISQSQTSRVRNRISQSRTGRKHEISQSQTSSEVKATAQLERESQEQVPQQESEETDTGSGESLRRALHHLDRLKTLVDDMNERKARAQDDGTDWSRTREN